MASTLTITIESNLDISSYAGSFSKELLRLVANVTGGAPAKVLELVAVADEAPAAAEEAAPEPVKPKWANVETAKKFNEAHTPAKGWQSLGW